MRLKVWFTLALACVGALLALGAPAARAEETPLSVSLSYVTSLSNWGPTTATGSALVWTKEAEVRVHAQGLPVLHNQMYAIWLVNTHQQRFLPVGRFNVSSDGSALVDVSLPGSVPSGYVVVLITVQPDPDTLHGQPSKQFSIAGFFPGNSATQQKVHTLPDTGEFAQHPPCAVTQTCPPAPAAPADLPWLPFIPLLATLVAFGLVLWGTNHWTRSARSG